ncbi:transglycosylase SLT domain-containing protein [Nonomuraea sp. NPDC050153]|uniref:transglycosylase SLT domain-containing protein n=1 Tax=Nonomuraea sp. NPDC050153 TaxID=3364359 RepID=UPI0037AE7F94
MSLDAPDITSLPGGDVLSGLLQKVIGVPQGIRDIASAWRACSFQPAKTTAELIRYVNDVDLKWEGDSADAFDRHMRLYPKAGEDFNTAVRAGAEALTNLANTMENAHNNVEALCRQALASAVTHIKDYLVKNPDKDYAAAVAALSADPGMISLMNGNIELAKSHVKTAEDAVVAARDTLKSHLDAGLGFFTNIPSPGGPDFVPGEEKVVWTKTPVQEQTQSAGGGSGSGGGVSSGGGTPAPKAEVVEWIKQALAIIKSPEMADTMRERAIDVSDLDANDPNDVQRIWAIIYHESGGNPGAINTWDINAQKGVPSQGLMQTIPPTFNAHALPGHGKILDPVDNIIAGVLYTYSRYGNLGGHPGISSLERGGGYRPY